jgi:hypothetical protein
MCESLKILNCIQSLKIVSRRDVCSYCAEPFKECDTLYSDGRFEVGEIDVIGFKESYYHTGCLLDYFRENDIYSNCANELVIILDRGYQEQNSNQTKTARELSKS